MLDYLPEVLAVTLAALGGAVGVLKVVAPLTDTEWDDKALTFTRRLHLRGRGRGQGPTLWLGRSHLRGGFGARRIATA